MEYIYRGKVPEELIEKALSTYEAYKADKQSLNDRICENDRWYKRWHEVNCDPVYRPDSNTLNSATAYVFSAIENKYADAIDNFPVPTVLEREPSDTQTAQLLSKILPVQLDLSGFKKCYKRNWRRKLKFGTGIYGVFYNAEKDDIELQALNILSVYCDMKIPDVQESQFLFLSQAIDNAALKNQYPDFAPLFEGDAAVDTFDGPATVRDRSEVLDCYYKKPDGSVHLIKFVRGQVIDASEDIPGYEKGIYAHGLYPVVFDVLYPQEDCPFGYGIVDIIRNPQMYVDQLDGIILKNAALSGKQRWLVKDRGAINEEEFKDWSCDIVHVDGSLDESHIRSVQAGGLSDFILQHRLEKINELKEVIGNRDFQQGGTTGGVTAASAISSLQQAGEKLSRSLIDDSFDAYKELIVMCVELIREFYSAERIYRITNELGNIEFAQFSNTLMTHVDYERDALGFPVAVKCRRAEFDIEIIPKRNSPNSREKNNQVVLELWKNGFFQPEQTEMALAALESMNFDGKERLMENLKKLKGATEYGLSDNTGRPAETGVEEGGE